MRSKKELYRVELRSIDDTKTSVSFIYSSEKDILEKATNELVAVQKETKAPTVFILYDITKI